jgi:hypothetical protein
LGEIDGHGTIASIGCGRQTAALDDRGLRMPGGKPLTRKREQAVAALLTAGTIARAAEQAGIAERTLRNWLREPEFAALYRARRLQVVEHAVGILQSASLSAVLALVRNLTCGKPGAEIAAAHHLLEHSLQAIQEFDVLSRLEALEQKAQQGANHAYDGAAQNGEARGAGR